PPAMRFAALLDRPFVGLAADSGLSRFLHRQAARAGRIPHHRVRVRSFDVVARLVGMGVGVAVMPLSAAQRWCADDAEIAPLADAWASRRLLVCTTPRSAASAGARALLGFLDQTGGLGKPVSA
ncbi:MAG TPA: LysR substrate-binding domain-containing protein, partial [Burkholderiaceae bacterium]|nr:LysR substrate-binding domain-containing protein [Burkholderiaceae bacterium]